MGEDTFQLVFRGEVLEGQSRPEVTERIGALLKLDAGQAAALFSGRTVVLKRSVTKAAAARYLAAFRAAGARLRILPARAAAPSPAAETPVRPPIADVGHLTAAPPNTGSFADLLPPSPAPPPAPDVSGLTLDPAGVDLSLPRYVAAPVLDLSRLSLAEVGADIGPVSVAAVPRAAPDFGLLQPGTELDASQGEKPPPPPDVSHLELS